MSNSLSIDRIIQLRDNLIQTVSSFADREQQLNDTYHTATLDARKDYEYQLKVLEADLAAQRNRANATLYQKQQDIKNAGIQRKEHIEQATRQSRKAALERIEHEEGTCKNQLQKEMMQTEQAYPKEKSRVTAVYESFLETLEQQHSRLIQLASDAYQVVEGYGSFVQMLSDTPHDETLHDKDDATLISELTQELESLKSATDAFRRLALPRFFRVLPLWLFITLALLAAFLLLPVFLYLKSGILTSVMTEVIIGIALCFITGVYIYGRKKSFPAAVHMAKALKQARYLHDAGREQATSRYTSELNAITQAHDQEMEKLQQMWEETTTHATRQRKQTTLDRTMRKEQAHKKNEQLCSLHLVRHEEQHAAIVQALEDDMADKKQQLTTVFEQANTKRDIAFQTEWNRLTQEWQNAVHPLYRNVQAAQTISNKLFPAWEATDWDTWTPPDSFIHSTRFGALQTDLTRDCTGLPTDQRLDLPGSPTFDLPLSLSIPSHGSVLFETKKTGQNMVIQTLNTIMLRLLLTTPPGKLSFTILDPVGLGQHFAGIMHLADYEEFLINSRIWTQPRQIEEQLAHLNEHMEKVIQMYLRNEYESITQYNDQAGDIAEKYHFLVVADFPSGFSDVAAKRLLSIATSGARCGVYSLIHWDQRLTLPDEFSPDELRASSICLASRGQRFVLEEETNRETAVSFDAPPSPERMTELLQKVGQASIDSNRIEVPFSHIAPNEPQLWSMDTAKELSVAIGRTGATKLQHLAIGRDTRQHGLVAGKTGSGKSNLFHVIITNMALWCSPEEVEFYLVDFKKGVEFKCYATHRLPHARVVAIESDREFGLSVLQRVDEELKQRGDLFRQLGVQDMEAYRHTTGTKPLPRTLLIIDEFQELFVEDDRIGQDAALLLDRIVRQGRAFGIHVLVGSQTLGGAYTLARTTIGQMVIRIALQCNEADAYLIMSDNNPAPRMLSRPGEAIYNNSAGTVEGNSPFQVVWLPDNVRETYLNRIQEHMVDSGRSYPVPIVFEGNTPTDICENTVLQELQRDKPNQPASPARIWMGAPNSIKGPTEAAFHRQSGNNLLIVGQRDETALSILASAMISLSAQYAPDQCTVFLLDGMPPGTAHDQYLNAFAEQHPNVYTRIKARDIQDIMQQLAEELQKRDADSTSSTPPVIFLMIHELQKFKKLRYEEDFSFALDDQAQADNPAEILNTLIKEGSRVGIHVIATCDTYNNVNRAFNRKTLSEFEMRILFQMSANDSASLIDSPDAGHLGLHRAIFYNEQEGYMETFRPYALPDPIHVEI